MNARLPLPHPPHPALARLAGFGAAPRFDRPKPTSNLVRPDPQRFKAHWLRIGQPGVDLVEELESRLADLHGVGHCITANSGFWMLALLMDAVRLPGRCEVVMPSLTYRRMADIVSWLGLVPHFCDIEPHTLANSARTVQACLGPDTALMIGVHPVGGHCDIEGLQDLSQRTGVPLIFDSVESVQERHAGRRIGGFGRAELFSLGASKLVNGFEGGYVTTDDAELATALRRASRGQGSGRVLDAPLPAVHAAMALAGLEDLSEQRVRNRLRFEAYRAGLSRLPGLRLVVPDPAFDPSHKNIVVEVQPQWPLDRDTTVELLNAENILARAYYHPPLTHKPIAYPHRAGALPHTDWAAARFISMPCGHQVSLEDIQGILEVLACLEQSAPAILEARTSRTPGVPAC